MKQTPNKVLEYGLMEAPVRDLLPDMRGGTVIAWRVDGEPQFWTKDADGREAPMRQVLVRHSPTGMEFGYQGSGPADFALNILALVVSPKEANRLHQDFKRGPMSDHFGRDGGSIDLATVRDWVLNVWRAEQADADLMKHEADLRTAAEFERKERERDRQDIAAADRSLVVD